MWPGEKGQVGGGEEPGEEGEGLGGGAEPAEEREGLRGGAEPVEKGKGPGGAEPVEKWEGLGGGRSLWRKGRDLEEGGACREGEGTWRGGA